MSAATLETRSSRISRATESRPTSSRRSVTASVGTFSKSTYADIRIGYVVGVPLWKASYRLSLPADPQADRARLQGWAILENFSGRDWHDVSLTLLSGNPVTFRQALFESYYVKRPSVPVEVAGRVLPSPDTGSIGAEPAARDAAVPAPAPQRKSSAMARSEAEAMPAPPPPASAPAQNLPAVSAESARPAGVRPESAGGAASPKGRAAPQADCHRTAALTPAYWLLR